MGELEKQKIKAIESLKGAKTHLEIAGELEEFKDYNRWIGELEDMVSGLRGDIG